MIVVINGKAKSGKSTVAAALRTYAIATGRGGLMIDEDQKGDTSALLEKIINGDRFVMGSKAEDVKWKKDPIVAAVGAGAKRLAELEQACPGFQKKMGPVINVTTEASK